MKARAAARAIVAAGGAGLLVAIACSESARSHVFSGRQYDQARGCLDHVTSIDIVDGPEPTAPCDPACIVSSPDDAGATQVYVSTMCAPYPQAPYDSRGTDARCARALAAYASNTTCETDGSIANVPDASDAASADASDAASAEASD